MYFWNGSHATTLQSVFFSPKLSNHRNVSLAVYLKIFYFSFCQKICINGPGFHCHCLLFSNDLVSKYFVPTCFNILYTLPNLCTAIPCNVIIGCFSQLLKVALFQRLPYFTRSKCVAWVNPIKLFTP